MKSIISAVRGLAAFSLLSLSVVACSAAPVESTEEDAAELQSTSAHFETFEGADGKTYFDLVAGNGQNVLRSQGYVSLQGAQKGMASVQDNGAHAAMFDVKEAKDGEYYFNLLAGNGEIIATSETYVSKSNANRAAKTVRSLIKLLNAQALFHGAAKSEHFETFTGEDGQTYFHLRAANGEIVLASEGYKQAAGAANGIASVRTNGTDAANYVVFETADGRFGFNLYAPNHKVIARGQSYSTKSNANRAVARIADILAANPR